MFCTVLLYFISKLDNIFVGVSKHPIGADQIENFESLSGTKDPISTDVGPQMMPPKSAIGYFSKREHPNADTQAEWYEKCTFLSFLFCWTFEKI